MKILSYFGAFLLVFTLSACGSGSGEPVTLVANTNEPAQSTDADATNQPSDDQSGDTGGSQGTSDNGDATNNGDADDHSDTSSNNSSDGDQSNDANSDTSGSNGNETDTGADSAGANDSDSGTTTGNNDTDNGNDTSDSSDANGGSDSGDNDANDASDGGHDDDSGPKIDPKSALGQMLSRINELAVRSIYSLNQSLSQGEMLTDQQEQCLGSYDPAIGEPVLSINCDQPLATGDVPIFTSVASLVDSAKCRTSLQENKGNACHTSQADLLIRTTFVTPEVGRPQPRAGATLSYNIVKDQLIIENLPQALSGRFLCIYNSRNGHPINNQDGSQVGNCNDQLTRLTTLIDDLLSIEH